MKAMDKAIYTGLFTLDVSQFEWNVAHLYEHMLIASFERHLDSHGYSRVTYGWCNGETFPGVMFVDVGFYDHRVKEIFYDFIAKPNRIDGSLLANELAKIQAEEESIIPGSVDDASLLSMLQKIDQLPIRNLEDETKILELDTHTDTHLAQVLTFNHDKTAFDTYHAVISLSDSNLEEQAVFMRLLPLLMQGTDKALGDIGMVALSSDSMPALDREQDRLYAVGSYRVLRADISPDTITIAVDGMLGQLKSTAQREALALYFNAFQSIPSWHTFPIDYYRHTGILASRHTISSLFSEVDLQDLLNRIDVDIFPSTAS